MEKAGIFITCEDASTQDIGVEYDKAVEQQFYLLRDTWVGQSKLHTDST